MSKLLVMSFDGDTQLEEPAFNDVTIAWEYADYIGSKWFFYPFYFIVSNSGHTIKDASFPLDRFVGKRVKTVKKIFDKAYKKLEESGEVVEPEEYAFIVTDNEKS